jgi:hypothetical protein
MANKPRDAVQAQINLIRKLKEEDCLSDYQIINRLGIDERTFYRYKKKLRTIDEKLWEKVHIDSRKYRIVMLLKTMEEIYEGNKKIFQDPKASNHDKTEASKVMGIAQRHMYDLVTRGPAAGYELPVPALPIIQEVKELTNASETDNV